MRFIESDHIAHLSLLYTYVYLYYTEYVECTSDLYSYIQMPYIMKIAAHESYFTTAISETYA